MAWGPISVGGAANANGYTLPAATADMLGGVKTGSNITNDGGTISMTKENVLAALGYTPANSSHTHDDRYYTEEEVDGKLAGKSNTSHTHDDRYYTETEVDTRLAGKANAQHTQDWSTIANTPAIVTAEGYEAETIEGLLEKVCGRYPQVGSVNFSKETRISSLWYNFAYITHRTGVGGDNADWGTLLLYSMTVSNEAYIVRVSMKAVQEIHRIYTSGYHPSADVASTLLQTNAYGSTQMSFCWNGKEGQPSWLWGGEDGTNMFVYNPLNFHVNYADNGVVASGDGYIRFGNGTQICWNTSAMTSDSTTSYKSRFTFGAPFFGTFYAVAGMKASRITYSGGSMEYDNFYVVNATSTYVELAEAYNGSAAGQYSTIIAIGRWK